MLIQIQLVRLLVGILDRALDPKGEDSRFMTKYLNVKIEMGVAGLIFEPHLPNFENQDNF